MSKQHLENAVLVRLSISLFNNSRQDREITDEVRARKGLSIGAGKWVKYKFPDEVFKAIREHAGEFRQWHYDNTLPWVDGERILTAARQPKYAEQLKTYQKQFGRLVRAFGDQYENWLKQAKLMHGQTFRDSDYPDWRGMKCQFALGAEYGPMPRADHFVVTGIANDAIEKMREELEAANKTRLDAAARDLWGRMMNPLTAMMEKLTDKNAIFRDTLIENLRDIVEMAPQLNLTASPEIRNALQVIKNELAPEKLDADQLRTDPVYRRDVGQTVKQLVKQFGAIGKRKFAA